MGDIKSTLDLVMEKTKDLSFSDEEKRNNKDADIYRNINGIVGKYQDNTLRYSEFEKKVRRLEKQHGTDCTGFVAEAVLRRFDFIADNGPLIGILKDFCGIESEPIQATINTFKEKALTAAGQRRHSIHDQLKKEHGISGSAVAANLENDASLKTTIKALQVQFKQSLAFLERNS